MGKGWGNPATEVAFSFSPSLSFLIHLMFSMARKTRTHAVLFCFCRTYLSIEKGKRLTTLPFYKKLLIKMYPYEIGQECPTCLIFKQISLIV